jgi:hypothetical protein
VDWKTGMRGKIFSRVDLQLTLKSNRAVRLIKMKSLTATMWKKQTMLFLITVTFSVTALSQNKWQTLFNGSDLSGWIRLNGTADYTIKDRVIIGTAKAGTANSFLATEKKFSDFILELDYKVDNGVNSGIQFRSLSNAQLNNGRVQGYQFEIDPSSRAWSGGLYDEARRGWLYNLEKNPSAKSAYKSLEWNHVRIEAVGQSIRTWLNGIECASILDDLPEAREGFVALQVHEISKPEDEGKIIQWKNIKIATENIKKSSRQRIRKCAR